MVLILLIPALSFFTTFFLTPFFIQYFKMCKIVSKDVHKRGKPLIPLSAGVPAFFGILIALLSLVSFQAFVFNDIASIVPILASILVFFFLMFVGFLDDLNTSQTKFKGFFEGKEGLKRWQKVLLTLPAALPLMAINAGVSKMALPFFGTVELGILYPLLIIPIGVFGCANMINMLGGYNGLEAGMGMIYTFFLGLYAYLTNSLAAFIFFSAFASLLAIFIYNKYPAKILAGDSLTYLLGGIVACGAIIGNMERVTLIVMTPFLIQGILKFYSRIKLGYFASDLGILKGKIIKPKYGKHVYSWLHLIENLGDFNEKQIVAIMMLIQLFFSILPFFI